MNNSTQVLESGIISFATSLYFIQSEVSDIVKLYFSSTASTLVTALASSTTPATTITGGGLSKGELTSGITLCQALQNFFGNAAVTTSDYLSTCENMINADTPATSALSSDVENIGLRLAKLGANLIQLNKNALNLVKLYNSSQLGTIISSLNAYTIVFGSSTTQSKMLTGVVLMQQFDDFMGNSAVTTGDYYSSVVIWSQGA